MIPIISSKDHTKPFSFRTRSLSPRVRNRAAIAIDRAHARSSAFFVEPDSFDHPMIVEGRRSFESEPISIIAERQLDHRRRV